MTLPGERPEAVEPVPVSAKTEARSHRLTVSLTTERQGLSKQEINVCKFKAVIKSVNQIFNFKSNVYFVLIS